VRGNEEKLPGKDVDLVELVQADELITVILVNKMKFTLKPPLSKEEA
jgi:hypothetical protein